MAVTRYSVSCVDIREHSQVFIENFCTPMVKFLTFCPWKEEEQQHNKVMCGNLQLRAAHNGEVIDWLALHCWNHIMGWKADLTLIDSL